MLYIVFVRCLSECLYIKDRPNFGFRFGFGAERVVFNTFGIVSVSVESNRGTFGNISVSAAVMPNFGSRDAEFRRAPKAGEIIRYGDPLQQVYMVVQDNNNSAEALLHGLISCPLCPCLHAQRHGGTAELQQLSRCRFARMPKNCFS